MHKPRRSQKNELMDLGLDYHTLQEYHDCLRQLGKIGRLLGGDQMTLRAFKSYTDAPKTILDVGSGGGQFTALLAKAYPQAQVLGIDLNREAVEFARQQYSAKFPNLSFKTLNWQELSQNYDVITSTFVCHHMADKDLVAFLRWAGQTAKQATIINDLHRHPLAIACFAVIAPIFFPNKLILHDGIVSIQRSFVKKDWNYYLAQADLMRSNWTIQRKMGFRWLVIGQQKAS